MSKPLLRIVPVPLLLLALWAAGSGRCYAQDSGVNLDIHANSHATAKEIGLPVYPGATLSKDDRDNDSTANLGLVFNSFHFSLLVVRYATSDSPEQVLDFYRKPLSRYGDVLECDHGKPVGELKEARGGLTCSSHQGHGEVNTSDSGEDHELRAGLPLRYRVVGIDSPQPGKTRFALVSLELPKDSDSNSK
jgi:hypothetical protein